LFLEYFWEIVLEKNEEQSIFLNESTMGRKRGIKNVKKGQ